MLVNKKYEGQVAFNGM